MGSGKSTIGRALAGHLGWPHVDVDEVLVARHGPIARQIGAEGEEVFRRRERAAVLELCDGVARVLSTGGGAFCDPISGPALREAYRVAWLDAPLEVLAERVRGTDRPMWGPDVADLLARRRPIYALADHRVDASAPLEEVVRDLASWCAEPPVEAP